LEQAIVSTFFVDTFQLQLCFFETFMSSLASIFNNLSPAQEAHKKQLMGVLQDYLPPMAIERCAELIMHYHLHLHIEVARKGRYGDYAPHSGHGNRISINYNLSPFEFLLTFIHELAHHTTYVKYGNLPEPHGAQWKAEFSLNMKPFLSVDLFPYDLKAAIQKHMVNPKFSHAADIALLKVLKKYDAKKQHQIHVNELENGYLFTIPSHPHIWMKKIKNLRTYALCEDATTKAQYKVHLMAQVQAYQAPE